ncbi:PIN domain-containing protein [Thermococcus sp. GR7]|uniref:type II toxin-antitoxin system VapC family toxin n=1 Tax=unclassified Thermococcus TaxID=2627626 RepID=UPI001432172C|nr:MULTISPECIES: type II toxin-antitoxin system VapC family toxin [unclassified Thermococcus]NJE45914.1 PIN domain-containing protein [Thermococcus sp. GR7]NJE78805.1 PIN domain-containing protein [Thermococcus sp. GR4]NJF22109.1 PIN domain-containing protein [Thermococcus sp. GR5]
MGHLTAFVDTNVIIEHLGGNIDLLDLRERFDVLYSNSIVFSEALMVYLRALTGERPYTLKHNPDIIRNLREELLDFSRLFELFLDLEINRTVETLSVEYMIKYGLLPNDALILATCKFYDVKYLISFDSDFANACENEGISLLSDPEEITRLGDVP